MKLMRLAICVAAFAIVGGIVVAEDLDVKALQAKLAAQEARLNDLQAKMGGGNCDGNVADGITSLRKNATVTLGGTVNTRYFYRSSRLRSTLAALDDNGARLEHRAKRAELKAGDLRVADAKVSLQIDVNDNFDAFIKMDLQGSGDNASDNAENAWIRWKNICNSGFGVLVGRDSLKYGMGPSVGILDSYSGTNGGTTADAFGESDPFVGWGNIGVPTNAWSGEGMFVAGPILPTHTGWDDGRTTQITPYWENCDGSFKAELSLMQATNTKNGMGALATRDNGRYIKYRSINYGIGTMSARVTWKPVEGLKIVASALNKHAKQRDGFWGYPTGNSWDNTGKDFESAGNNLAASIGIEYTPAFFSKLTVWGYYQHGWNEGWVKDMDSDLVNAGLKFDITDQFYAFAQGDYLYVKNSKGNTWHKSNAWAAYAGFGYTLPYGVNFETGYRHDNIAFKDRAGLKHTKYNTDTIYAHLGFDF